MGLPKYCESDNNFYTALLKDYKEDGENYEMFWRNHSKKIKLSDIESYDLMWYIGVYENDIDYRGLWANFFTIVLNDRRIKKINKIKNNLIYENNKF